MCILMLISEEETVWIQYKIGLENENLHKSVEFMGFAQ